MANAKGLMNAAFNGELEEVKCLICDKKVNVNARSKELHSLVIDSFGNSSYDACVVSSLH